MNSFIHTFSVDTKITNDELSKLYAAYDKGNGRMFCNDTKYVLPAYAENGLRIEIKQCQGIECQMDKEHCKYKATMIFTLYKLLHPGESMGMLTRAEEIVAAVNKICEILSEIDDKSGVKLWVRAKIKRVDVTRDMHTPSDDYTKEIIRLAKKSVLRYGYCFWEPSKEEQNKHSDWKVEDAAFYNNHNRELEAKIYNKKNDASIKPSPEFDTSGLVRFELTLKRGFLKKNDYLNEEPLDSYDLAEMLIGITKRSGLLLAQEIGRVLDDGDFLSKKVLEKYIQKSYKGKNKRIDDMINYAKFSSTGKRAEFGSSEKRRRIEKYFIELGVSPIYSKKECPYIPSFFSLLNDDSPNQKLLGMAQRYNEKRGHEYIYWGD